MIRRRLFPILILAALAITGSGRARAGRLDAAAGPTRLYLPLIGRNSPLQTVFGVELGAILPAEGLDLFPTRSVSPTTWVRRAALSWRLAEPTEGVYNWNAAGLDAEMQQAAQNGLRVILIVRDAPAWAAPRVCGPINSAKLPAFARFVAAAARRYPMVQYWEIWNEPDVDPVDVQDPQWQQYMGCWGNKNDAYYGGGSYANMLKAVYPAVKAANPQAQIIAGALLLNNDPTGKTKQPGNFLEGILRGGGGPVLDGVSFHAYDYYLRYSDYPTHTVLCNGGVGCYASVFNSASLWNNTGPALVTKTRFVKAMLAKYRLTGKFVMNTEVAIISDAGCDDLCELTKAGYVAQAYAAALAEGLRANIWYRALGWPTRNTALLDPSTHQPLPAYAAYQTAAGLLGAATYLDANIGTSGLKGYRFLRNRRPLWLAWSPDGVVRSLTLPAVPTRVWNVLGEEQVVAGAAWSVGASPVWIELP